MRATALLRNARKIEPGYGVAVPATVEQCYHCRVLSSACRVTQISKHMATPRGIGRRGIYWTEKSYKNEWRRPPSPARAAGIRLRVMRIVDKCR